MANLLKRKVNSLRHNKTKTILSQVDLSAMRDNTTGQVKIRINSNADDGEEEFYLELDKDDVNSIKWSFEDRVKK